MRKDAIHAPTKIQAKITVDIWSVFAGPRFSIGAWRVPVRETLRPPSFTWRSMRTMRKIADTRIMTGTDARIKFIIGGIKYHVSLIKSLFFAIFFAIYQKVWHSVSVYEKNPLYTTWFYPDIPLCISIYRGYRQIGLYSRYYQYVSIVPSTTC